MRIRRTLAGLLFAVIVLGGIDVGLVRLLFADRATLHTALSQATDQRTPAYPHFLEEVARHTKPGQSIALLVPMRHWNDGYAYAYFRATYFLVERRVTPLVDPDDSVHFERIHEVDLLAAWQMPAPPGRWTAVWAGHGGTLMRRMD